MPRSQAANACLFFTSMIFTCALMAFVGLYFVKGQKSTDAPLLCRMEHYDERPSLMVNDPDKYFECTPVDFDGQESLISYALELPPEIVNKHEDSLQAGELYVYIPKATLSGKFVIVSPHVEVEVTAAPWTNLICHVSEVDRGNGEEYRCTPVAENGERGGVRYILPLPSSYFDPYRSQLESEDLYISIPGAFVEGLSVVIPSYAEPTVADQPGTEVYSPGGRPASPNPTGALICHLRLVEDHYECFALDDNGWEADVGYPLQLPESFRNEYQVDLQEGLFVSIQGGTISNNVVVVPDGVAIVVIAAPTLTCLVSVNDAAYQVYVNLGEQGYPDYFECSPIDKRGHEADAKYDIELPYHFADDYTSELEAGELYVAVAGGRLVDDRVVVPDMDKIDVVDKPAKSYVVDNVLECHILLVDHFLECIPLDENGWEQQQQYPLELPESFVDDNFDVLEDGGLYISISGADVDIVNHVVFIPNGAKIEIIPAPVLICRVSIDQVEQQVGVQDPSDYYLCTPVGVNGQEMELTYDLELPESFADDYQSELEDGDLMVSIPGGRLYMDRVIIPDMDTVSVMHNSEAPALVCHISMVNGYLVCNRIDENGQESDIGYPIELSESFVSTYQDDLARGDLYVAVPGGTIQNHVVSIPDGVTVVAVPAPFLICHVTAVGGSAGETRYKCNPVNSQGESSTTYDLWDLPQEIVDAHQDELQSGDLYISILGGMLGSTGRVDIPEGAVITVVDNPFATNAEEEALVCRLFLVDEYTACHPIDEDGEEDPLGYPIELPGSLLADHQAELEQGALYISIPGGTIENHVVVIPDGAVITVLDGPPSNAVVNDVLLCHVLLVEDLTVCHPIDENGEEDSNAYSIELPVTFLADHIYQLEQGELRISIPGGTIVGQAVVIPEDAVITVVEDALICRIFTVNDFARCSPVDQNGQEDNSSYPIELPVSFLLEHESQIEQGLLFISIPGGTIENDSVVIPDGAVIEVLEAPSSSSSVNGVLLCHILTVNEYTVCHSVDEDGQEDESGYPIQLPLALISDHLDELDQGILYVSIPGGSIEHHVVVIPDDATVIPVFLVCHVSEVDVNVGVLGYQGLYVCDPIGYVGGDQTTYNLNLPQEFIDDNREELRTGNTFISIPGGTIVDDYVAVPENTQISIVDAPV